ncbi:hypothetical protein SISNIDRAFT_494524 [Sistotremastrum niveocremeum HHB9708]|uniref:Uncharacterized protein n=2 Tax=Sistotremastraceae TaxID=3402574 RepID=A0A164WJH2_9AGAM|nr:hypothetical protein SISNIDRAFT_494524 [Sistotremastrum niveocremeum HHB9708]KZT34628.1 hypothetical protein SISSUDRAFT_1122132 [Sistotremastrum suecicum HHB10207 ss-3]
MTHKDTTCCEDSGVGKDEAEFEAEYFAQFLRFGRVWLFTLLNPQFRSRQFVANHLQAILVFYNTRDLWLGIIPTTPEATIVQRYESGTVNRIAKPFVPVSPPNRSTSSIVGIFCAGHIVDLVKPEYNKRRVASNIFISPPSTSPFLNIAQSFTLLESRFLRYTIESSNATTIRCGRCVSIGLSRIRKISTPSTKSVCFGLPPGSRSGGACIHFSVR